MKQIYTLILMFVFFASNGQNTIDFPDAFGTTIYLREGAGIRFDGSYSDWTIVNTIVNNNQLTNGSNYITSSALTPYATTASLTSGLAAKISTGASIPFSTITGFTSSNVSTALGFTPTNSTTTLTINGVTYDLSANRSWTVTAAPTGTAGGQLSGTYPNPNVINVTGATNGANATSGNVGEYIESKIPTGSAVALANGATSNITSISLPAGDWDIQASVVYNSTLATITGKTSGVNTTSATLPTDGSEVPSGLLQTLITGKDGATLPRKRISSSSATTVYLVANCAFSLGNVTAYGILNARRVR